MISCRHHDGASNVRTTSGDPEGSSITRHPTDFNLWVRVTVAFRQASEPGPPSLQPHYAEHQPSHAAV